MSYPSCIWHILLFSNSCHKCNLFHSRFPVLVQAEHVRIPYENQESLGTSYGHVESLGEKSKMLLDKSALDNPKGCAISGPPFKSMNYFSVHTRASLGMT